MAAAALAASNASGSLSYYGGLVSKRFESISGVAALAEAVRRRLYDYVASQADAVGRDDAAAAVGVKRPLAAFHLDKLVEEGLLDVEYRRLTGRTGPGAGRPAKLYRRSQRQIDISLPPRAYDLAAGMLAAAIQRSADTGEEVKEALRSVASERGLALAGDGGRDGVEALLRTLGDLGYEARQQGSEVILANCPFHALAQDFRTLVCGMNLAFCHGLAEGLDLPASGLRPHLRPGEKGCCVTFEEVA